VVEAEVVEDELLVERLNVVAKLGQVAVSLR
jgi:hypothetical protein